MLNCREMSEHASELVEGRGPWRERAGAQLHLLMCDYCRRYFEQLRLTIETLRHVRHAAVTFDTAQVLAKIDRGESDGT